MKRETGDEPRHEDEQWEWEIGCDNRFGGRSRNTNKASRVFGDEDNIIHVTLPEKQQQ